MNSFSSYFPARSSTNDLLAGFIESQFSSNIRSFATLTVPYYTSADKLNAFFGDWINTNQAHNFCTLGFVKAIEKYPSPHVHSLVIASCPIDNTYAASSWLSVTGCTNYREGAKIEPYKVGNNGSSYLLKTLYSDFENIVMSSNLEHFSVSNCSTRVNNSRSRRQAIRIHAQRIQ